MIFSVSYVNELFKETTSHTLSYSLRILKGSCFPLYFLASNKLLNFQFTACFSKRVQNYKHFLN